MKDHRASILCLISVFLLFFITRIAVAQEDAPEQLQNGEAGYKVGCSLAASLGKVVCGELPSGKRAQADQNSADASAAIITVQKLQADAGVVSTATSQALQNLQQQDSQGSADTSAAIAALQYSKRFRAMHRRSWKFRWTARRDR